MGQALQLAVTLTSIDCGCCGGTYAINERYRAKQAEEGGSWHCPYCQVSWGYAGGENARLRKEVAAEKARHQETLSRLNQAEAEKARVERKLKRVGRGVCPCCNRTFPNLARHMATKHPKEPKS